MSRISQVDKNRMYALAVEIIELKAENEAARAKGYDPDSTAICNLYDQSDSEWCAERIKSLLDELRETQEQNARLKVALEEFDTPTRADIASRARTLTLHIGGLNGPTA